MCPDWAIFIQKQPKHQVTFCVTFKNVIFELKTAVTHFQPTFGKIRLLFIQSSGHTGLHHTLIHCNRKFLSPFIALGSAVAFPIFI